jgi:hypothetical protein
MGKGIRENGEWRMELLRLTQSDVVSHSKKVSYC